MNLRMANIDDLQQLKVVYEKIIYNMNNINIWDEIYPCDFFLDDIKNNSLYILEEDNEIISAFALCNSTEGEKCVNWENKHVEALYIDRLGVNVNYSRRGIGSIMIRNAITLAKDKGAKYLRLFVVDINKPAINLYIKNGFKQVEGIYDKIIDDDIVLHEFGFEIKI
ncbi:GNAT family N-acetyltransferase [Clostridium ihumii]|uniref:GNAT family N-acetyltransferase n=1 Tax=Clostridium ihumii TaxID=1470356 RepID=UPI003D32C22E